MNRHAIVALALVIASMVQAAPADAAPSCGAESVWLFEGINRSEGCAGFDFDDGNFDGDTYHNGRALNNTVTSIDLDTDTRVLMYDYGGFGGETKEYNRTIDWIGPAVNDRFSSMMVFSDGTCPSSVFVRLYNDASYTGGCKTLSYVGTDRDFQYNYFDNGVTLNDRVTSVVVAPGYKATLYSGADFTGTATTVAGSTPDLSSRGMNDVVSSIWVQQVPPDYVAPTVDFSGFNGSGAFVMTRLSSFTGIASDDSSGIANVRVQLTGVLSYSLAANLTCSSDARSCSFRSDPLTIAPGRYSATAYATDAAGNVGNSRTVSVIIV